MKFETPSFTLILSSQPTGKIVYTCQVNGDQICIINADGSGIRQLITDSVRHWYPSLALDEESVVYSAFRTDNLYEIYEIDHSGTLIQLTNGLGIYKH